MIMPVMNRPVVEFPLFYGDEREDVREFLSNYRRAGILNQVGTKKN